MKKIIILLFLSIFVSSCFSKDNNKQNEEVLDINNNVIIIGSGVIENNTSGSANGGIESQENPINL